VRAGSSDPPVRRGPSDAGLHHFDMEQYASRISRSDLPTHLEEEEFRDWATWHRSFSFLKMRTDSRAGGWPNAAALPSDPARQRCLLGL